MLALLLKLTLLAARDVAAAENNTHFYAQTNGGLSSQPGGMPNATYSTFQDSGHYSIKVQLICVCMIVILSLLILHVNVFQRLYTEDDEPDIEEVNGSIITNSVAIQTDTLPREKQVSNVSFLY